METAFGFNKFRRARRLLLAFAFLAPCLGFYLVRLNVVVALAPIFLSHVLLLYATLSANCQWFGPVIRSFETDQPEVWLTIDDGPSPIHTTAMLDLLDRFDARATFFVIGKQAEQYPHLLTEILTRGHEIEAGDGDPMGSPGTAPDLITYTTIVPILAAARSLAVFGTLDPDNATPAAPEGSANKPHVSISNRTAAAIC